MEDYDFVTGIDYKAIIDADGYIDRIWGTVWLYKQMSEDELMKILEAIQSPVIPELIPQRYQKVTRVTSREILTIATRGHLDELIYNLVIKGWWYRKRDSALFFVAGVTNNRLPFVEDEFGGQLITNIETECKE